MEFFKSILFGVAGLSMIFWVAVIGLWHVDMFPRFFAEESNKRPSANRNTSMGSADTSSLLAPTTRGLLDRGKYTRKSFVIADFSAIEDGYGVNRLYALIMLSLAAMSFIILGYGLHSAFVI